MASMIKLVHQVRKAVRGARRELGFSLPLIRGKQHARVMAHGVAEKRRGVQGIFTAPPMSDSTERRHLIAIKESSPGTRRGKARAMNLIRAQVGQANEERAECNPPLRVNAESLKN
jgi:hypothetical protein